MFVFEGTSLKNNFIVLSIVSELHRWPNFIVPYHAYRQICQCSFQPEFIAEIRQYFHQHPFHDPAIRAG